MKGVRQLLKMNSVNFAANFFNKSTGMTASLFNAMIFKHSS